MDERCRIDKTVERVAVGEFRFPLGVYPIEPMTPQPGFISEFEQGDGEDEVGEWESWPDRYVWDVVVSAQRLAPLCRSLFSLMPLKVFPILDFIGHDAYREIDSYVSYDAVGLDRFLDGIIAFGPFLFEDGMCGFGAMCEDPFLYVFIDEHKIVTIRAEPSLKEAIDGALAAFDLQAIAEPSGADAASHEHRGVLFTPEEEPKYLTAEQIVERLRDAWRLALNVDPEQNVDDEGNHLGATLWRCLVRVEIDESGTEERGGDNPVSGKPSEPDDAALDAEHSEVAEDTDAASGSEGDLVPTQMRYTEVLLVADCLADAEEMAFDAVDATIADHAEPVVLIDSALIAADRLTPIQMDEVLASTRNEGAGQGDERLGRTGAEWLNEGPGVISTRWLS